MKSLEVLPERIERLETQVVQFRQEVRDEFSAVRREMREQGETLRGEIRTGDEETRVLMRVLHEEVLSRLLVIREGQGQATSPTNRRRKRR